MKAQLPIMFSTRYPTAKKEYACDGCGEVKIVPSDVYMLSSSRQPDGTFSRHRYCIRCACAIQASVNRKGARAVEPGSLRWSRLAAPFKKAFLKFIKTASAAKTEEESAKAKKIFVEEIGICGLSCGTMSLEEKKQRKQWRKKRMEKQEKKEQILKDALNQVEIQREYLKKIRRMMIQVRTDTTGDIIERTQEVMDFLGKALKND